jgi:RHS repeat-associated protein
VTYDTAGNLTAWNGNQYTWDAFNQMSRYQSGGAEWIYVYDAEDERVWTYKTDNTSRWTLRDLGNRVLREYANTGGTWSLDADHIYRDGLLLASETPAGVRHYHLDHLGTPRLVTNAAGAQTAYHAYFPFGEEATAFNQDTLRMKFTGHERDHANAGGPGDDLDYMHARFCSPVTGVFGGGPEVPPSRAKQPQKWNRYTYADGNPVKKIDPDGKEAMVFVVAPSSVGDPKGLVGHAAMYVTSSKGSAGVSAFGDYRFGKGQGPKEFIRGYQREGRGVKIFILKTTPEQDAKMVDFMKKSVDGGIDKSRSIAFENCTTACENVMRSGGVIGRSDSPGSSFSTLFFDSPRALEQSLTSGELSSQVTLAIDLPVEEEADSGAQQKRVDPK